MAEARLSTLPHTASIDEARARIAGGILAAAVLAMHVAPRGSWIYLTVLAGTLFTLLIQSGWRLNQAKLPTPTGLGLFAFGALALLGTAWAAIPEMAVRSGVALMAQVGLAIVASDAVARLPYRAISRLSEGLLIGFALGLAFLVFEGATRVSIHRLFYSILPYLAPGDDPEQLASNGGAAQIGTVIVKRSVAETALLLWPVLLILSHVFNVHYRQAIAAVTLAFAVLAAVLINHDSSLLAVSLGLAALTGARFSFRATWSAIVAIWCALTLLVVPAALWEFQARLFDLKWLQFSAGHRLVIWGYSAGQVLNAPLLGIGAGSGGVLDARRAHIDKLPGTEFPLSTANHQHDIFLQTWYEMGGLGAVVLCGAGLIALWRLRRLPDQVRGYGLATFASAMGMVSTSYGLWQEWFEASIAISAIALVIAIRRARVEAFDVDLR